MLVPLLTSEHLFGVACWRERDPVGNCDISARDQDAGHTVAKRSEHEVFTCTTKHIKYKIICQSLLFEKSRTKLRILCKYIHDASLGLIGLAKPV